MRSWMMACVVFTLASAAMADGWYATRVVQYVAGSGASPGHRNASAALGEPARMTGPANDPETVTPFQPSWMPSQIVSIGAGGSLTLELGTPATDDPNHRFGVDLIVYGNAMFADLAYPLGVPSWCAGEGGLVDVSADGVTWLNVPGVVVDGPLPTMAWMDAGPYDAAPGQVPTDFLRAVDPSLTDVTAAGLEYPALAAAYGGGAGGAGVDLASVGLSSARFVRFRHPPGATGSPEIDAVAVVPPAFSPFDLDRSGLIDLGDVALLLLCMGELGGEADLDGSGMVDYGDVAILLMEMNA